MERFIELWIGIFRRRCFLFPAIVLLSGLIEGPEHWAIQLVARENPSFWAVSPSTHVAFFANRGTCDTAMTEPKPLTTPNPLQVMSPSTIHYVIIHPTIYLCLTDFFS
jgi:hypothetical protein